MPIQPASAQRPPLFKPAEQPEWGSAYSASAGVFRCPPSPVTVTKATRLPQPLPNNDAIITSAVRSALKSAGLSEQQLTRFAQDGGVKSLLPIARFFGEGAFAELLARLRYPAAKIVAPFHSYDTDADARQKLGVQSVAVLLVPRLLACIPGHFRELARRASGADEAHALESLGWIFMSALRSEVRKSGQPSWWIPPAPDFVTPLPEALPPLSGTIYSLALRTGQIDTSLPYPVYRERFNTWSIGCAGQAWRLETGIQQAKSGQPPGQPFYAEVVPGGIPQGIRLPNAATQQLDNSWRTLVATVSPVTSKSAADKLRKSNEATLPAATANLITKIDLGGVRLVEDNFPVLSTHRSIYKQLRVLKDAADVFKKFFTTIRSLGWNDLILESAGGFSFRGVKLPWDPNNPQRYYAAAQRLSNHGHGLAIDINDFENPQKSTPAIDPRVVAIFEAFHFSWGRCFSVTDPHHFEYCGAGC
jgi:D-alanyl-D-alanine carboxypeptidase